MVRLAGLRGYDRRDGRKCAEGEGGQLEGEHGERTAEAS